MRRLFLFIAAVAVALLSFNSVAFAGPKAQRDTIKILAIGNSFSEDAIETRLYGLFEAEGIDVIIGNLYIGGCSLERHFGNTTNGKTDYRYRRIVGGETTTYKNVDIDFGLCDQDWDYVSFQQSSGVSGLIDTYTPYIQGLMDYVKSKVKSDYKTIWHMTWAYAKDSDHKAFPNYDRNQMKMYNAIIGVAKEIVPKYGFDLLIPCGTTIQNARTSYLGDTLNRDGFHLDKAYGRYAAACTWFEVITGISVVGNKYIPEGVDPKCAKVCQLSAHKAVKTPYKVSKVK